MIDLILRYFSFAWRKSRFIFCLQVAVVLSLLYWILTVINFQILGENLFASFVGFVAGAILVMAILNKLGVHEDERKVCYDDDQLRLQYKKKYWHVFTLHPGEQLDISQVVSEKLTDVEGSLFDKAYHWVRLFISRGWYHLLNRHLSKNATSDKARVYAEKLFGGANLWDLVDNPQQQFELDGFIMSQYSKIMAAHGRSKHKASLTVRLQDCQLGKDGVYHLVTTRSTYLAHLLTNRAIDYKIDGKFSLREVYENRDTLVPLNKSKMSNHIGINALVFLSEEGTGNKKDRKYLLLAERDKTGTIAKYMLTASVAIRLDMDDLESPLRQEYLRRDAVLNYMPQSLGVSDTWLNSIGQPSITFLGASRDIYEGGKPTFFYEVDLCANAKQYMRARHEYKNSGSQKDEGVDKVAHMHVALWKTLRMNPHEMSKKMRDKLSYTALRHYKYWIKSVEYSRACEKNLLAALWFLGGCEESNE